MATTVTTFQREKTGNLVFPVYTKWGIIENPELTNYASAMEEMGHEWTSSDIYAFDTFITKGKNDGWWGSMMAIFPLWGTEPECLRVPLVQKIGAAKLATLGGTSTYDVPSPDWNAVSVKNGDRVIGFTPLINRVMASPYTIYEILTSLGINDAVVRGGYTAIFQCNDSSANQRFWGQSTANYYADGTEAAFALGIQAVTTNPVTRACIGRVLTGRTIVPTAYSYVKVKIKDNLGIAGIIFGDINNVSIEKANITAGPAKAIKLIYAQKVKFGIGGWTAADENGDFTGSASSAVGSITRWHSVDKGDMDDSQEFAYHSAIKELFAALGK